MCTCTYMKQACGGSDQLVNSPNFRLHVGLCSSKFWTRNRPGDKMRDRYNLNLLPGMSEDGLEYGELQDACGRMWTRPQDPDVRVVCVSDDVDLNSVASIPGMGIPEQLKAAMEQEQSSRSNPDLDPDL